MGFRRLKSGANFVTAYNKYKEWEDKTPGEKQTAYEGLNVDRFTYEKQVIYVAPFNVAGLDLYIEAKAPATGQNQPTPVLLDLAATYFQTVAPATAGVTIVTDNQIFSPGKLAKLIVKQRTATATSRSNSRITTAKYYRHKTNSASMPFGKKAANDSFASVLAAIKANAAYNKFLETKGNAISVKPEGSV